MGARVPGFKAVKGKDGKVRLVEKQKRYDVCTELKRATSKRIRVKKGKGNV